ncbi:MAG: OmpA family protein [Geminicoccaceae bacterium]|nr:OmpA family protein [Geminicoccaceae bacterium]
MRTRSRRDPVDIWPGFVDALSTLLMVFIFLLVVFILGQFFLSQLLEGRDEEVDQLERTVAGLTRELDLERETVGDLRDDMARLSDDLGAARTARDDARALLDEREAERDELDRRLALLLSQQDTLQRELTERTESAEETARRAEQLRAALEAAETTVAAERETVELQLAQLAALKTQTADLERLREDLRRQVAELTATLASRDETLQSLEGSLDAREQERLAALAQVQELSRQLQTVSRQLGELDRVVGDKQTQIERQAQQIERLGDRLNQALAEKVEELSRFRSDFFGRLRDVLGAREDMRIVGDRFVFQSEVLFASGEAEIGAEGRRQLAAVARTLKELTADLPDELPWVLQVDGHTDRRPIATTRYPSNWELSTARAVSVARFLIEQGIPAERVAARGLAEFQPLDEGEGEEAFRRNRRIEIKVTTR